MGQPFQVFISHFTGEERIAEKFQTFLRASFPGLTVFRSSDAESIPTGEGQYAAILSALDRADIFIVLLSSDSSRRPWVAFESGFGMGKKARIFPLLVRGARPGDLPSPFSEMLLRPLGRDEVGKVLAAVAQHTGMTRIATDIDQFLGEVLKAEMAIPDVRLALEPYIDAGKNLCFRLHYEGYKPLTLQVIVAGIPTSIKEPNWPILPVPGHLQVDQRDVEGTPYSFKEYIASLSPPDAWHGGQHFRVLRPALLPSAAPVDLDELRFALNKNIDVFKDEHLIRCWIETTEFRTDEQKISMSGLKAG